MYLCELWGTTCSQKLRTPAIIDLYNTVHSVSVSHERLRTRGPKPQLLIYRSRRLDCGNDLALRVRLGQQPAAEDMLHCCLPPRACMGTETSNNCSSIFLQARSVATSSLHARNNSGLSRVACLLFLQSVRTREQKEGTIAMRLKTCARCRSVI